MDAEQVGNRRKQRDSTRRYKLCHSVVLAVFQTCAGIPARKFCQGQIKWGRVKGGQDASL